MDGLKQQDVKGGQSVIECVQEYYGQVLKSSESLKTNACTSCAPPLSIRQVLTRVPDEVIAKYYGCGSPFPHLLDGLKVLDLGSGSGRDCYVLAELVGQSGFVTGVDMTEEQLAVARRHLESFCLETLGYKQVNMTFKQGYIEDLIAAGIEPNSQDLVISNCVVNLSPDKRSVLRSVFDVLKHGGEFYFSDVYCDRRLPDAARKDPVLFGECLGGALYEHDFIQLCKAVGFADPREVSRSEIEVKEKEVRDLVGNATFYSITYRLFKLNDLEPYCEDYGQVAIYLGTIPDQEARFVLDASHTFEAHRPMLICGNTQQMLTETRFRPHFQIIGNRERHFGAFDCKQTPPSNGAAKQQLSGCC
eukprot:m.254293 g.254293  ORF g.254293 m.254293 type:complete len:361 (-) comp17902_c0_seq1:277-1359(-)